MTARARRPRLTALRSQGPGEGPLERRAIHIRRVSGIDERQFVRLNFDDGMAECAFEQYRRLKSQ